MLSATRDRSNGKAAGVGEKIEHALAGGLLLNPAPAVTHVEKQPVVLLDAQVKLVAQAVLADQPRLDRLAQQQLHVAIRQITVLQQQRVRPARLPGLTSRQDRKHLDQCIQFRCGRLAKQRDQHHPLQPVRRDVLKPGPAAPSSVKYPAGFIGHLGQGLAEVLLKGGKGIGQHDQVISKKARAF